MSTIATPPSAVTGALCVPAPAWLITAPTQGQPTARLPESALFCPPVQDPGGPTGTHGRARTTGAGSSLGRVQLRILANPGVCTLSRHATWLRQSTAGRAVPFPGAPFARRSPERARPATSGFALCRSRAGSVAAARSHGAGPCSPPWQGVARVSCPEHRWRCRRRERHAGIAASAPEMLPHVA